MRLETTFQEHFGERGKAFTRSACLGLVRRRRGERKAAQEELGAARNLFTDIGSRLWADRAEAELRRIPIRRRASALEELTPTEQQVADLAAAGRTNREVAQALFMSPKTVEANLSRVYRKLGIRSRAELGAKMAVRGGVAAKP